MTATAQNIFSCNDLDQFIRSISALRRRFGDAFLLTRCAELCRLPLPLCVADLALFDRLGNCQGEVL